MDKTDSAILKVLSQNSLMPASELAKTLKKDKILLTERGIRKRIVSLQKDGVIKKNTVLIDDEFAGRNVKRLILVKFSNVKNFSQRLDEYKKYVSSSPYCTFAVRIRGDFDWLHYKCFPTKDLADREDDIFRSIFGDLMQEYRSYDAEVMKNNFDNILEIGTITDHLDKVSN